MLCHVWGNAQCFVQEAVLLASLPTIQGVVAIDGETPPFIYLLTAGQMILTLPNNEKKYFVIGEDGAMASLHDRLLDIIATSLTPLDPSGADR